MMNNFRYAGIEYDDTANGYGLGAVFFTQYCPHHCKGCHNPTTWKKDGGYELTENIYEKLFTYYENVPFASRLTLSGGDPIANIEVSSYIASEFKRRFPNKTLWIYTGYKLEDIRDDTKYKQLLKLADYLVDSQFEIDKRDITLKFRGSSNQRIWKKVNDEWVIEENEYD